MRCKRLTTRPILPRHRQNEPDMSLQTTPSDRKPDIRQRLSPKCRAALDNMARKGMRWQDAAINADYPTQAMWKALQLTHVQAYLRTQREVFRASLVDRATFRMIELSEQDDNRAAAFSATSKLMSEADEQVSSGSHRAAPGLVVQIINSPVASHATSVKAQVVDITAQSDDTARDD